MSDSGDSDGNNVSSSDYSDDGGDYSVDLTDRDRQVLTGIVQGMYAYAMLSLGLQRHFDNQILCF